MDEKIKTDCQVCKQLIKEKHRNMIWWKIGCIIFAALAIVLGILYFGSGAVKTETNLDVYENTIQNSGDNTIVIGSEQVGNTYSGTIERTDYTPIICITVIASIAVLVAGGVIIANYVKKDS